MHADDINSNWIYPEEDGDLLCYEMKINNKENWMLVYLKSPEPKIESSYFYFYHNEGK